MQVQVSNFKRRMVPKILLSHSGQFFSVRFIKRTTGTMRVLNGHTSKQKHTTQPKYRFNPAERGLFPAFDLQKNDWRFINLDGVEEVKIGGHTYIFAEPQCPGLDDETTTYLYERPARRPSFEEARKAVSVLFE